MRIRIGSYNDKYWVEMKRGFIWRRLPSLQHFRDCSMLRWEPRYRETFNGYEAARKLAEDYIMEFNKSAAVYTEIKA
jgi:hypothetical protein